MKKIAYYVCSLMMMLSNSSVYAEETIDIAAIYALTGAAAENNALSLQGIRYGVDVINAQGGVLGKKIKLLKFNNLSTPIGSNMAAKKAVEANVVAILGAAWSSHSLAVARVAQTQGIPMISNVSTNPHVTKIGNYIYRVCFTDDFQGKVMARFARQALDAKTAVVFTDVASDYSIELAKVFQSNFKQLGGNVLLELEYKHIQETFDTQIQLAKRANADVIFLSGHDEGGLIAKQAQDAGILSIPLGGDGWDSHAFLSRGGADLRQGYYCTHWSASMDSKYSRVFIERYKYVGNIFAQTVLGYDAVLLLADAIRRAGSVDRDKIRKALAHTRSFKGVTGTITFNEHGDPVKSAVIMEIKNGRPRYLKTLEP